MRYDSVSLEVSELVQSYAGRLDLQSYPISVTCSRPTFEKWLGRKINASIGGAYIYHARSKTHLVFVNLRRLNHQQPNAVEIVVAEELLHMRHWLDGDRRRHAHHGYDRIAKQVAELVGCSMEDVRNCLIPVKRRPFRYLYRCPSCAMEVPRKRKGTWSCGKCSPRFNPKYVLEIVAHFPAESDTE
jgi:predicted SprT family Zn-dependent metalloprotease